MFCFTIVLGLLDWPEYEVTRNLEPDGGRYD